MRIILFIVFLLLLDGYVYQPFQASIQSTGKSLRLILQIIYWSIPAISILFLVLYQAGYAHWLPGNNGRSVLSAMLVLAYVCKVLVLPFIFFDDFRRSILFLVSWWQEPTPHMPSRSRFLSTLGLTAGLLPFSMLLYGMWRNPYRYKTHHALIPVAGLPSDLEGLRIVQISDIHSGSFTLTEPVENAIRMVNDLSPDVVCFTGDLVNNQAAEMAPFIKMFSGIQSRYGVYSILGNHDYGDYHRWPDTESKKANFELLMDTHRQMGWDLLLNEHRILQIGQEKLAILGVENYSAHPRFHQYGDLNKAIVGTENVPFKLLLSHDPSHWDAQVVDRNKEIFLTLSGHTHGMQFGIEIPGWLKWSPIQYMYKQWAGLYSKGEQYLYVNRGLGFLGYPGRVGILPEITLLELTRANTAV